jgi:hypothetical protein
LILRRLKWSDHIMCCFLQLWCCFVVILLQYRGILADLFEMWWCEDLQTIEVRWRYCVLVYGFLMMFPRDVAIVNRNYMIFLLDALMLWWFWDFGEVMLFCVVIWISDDVSSWYCSSQEESCDIFVGLADVLMILRFKWSDAILCSYMAFWWCFLLMLREERGLIWYFC